MPTLVSQLRQSLDTLSVIEEVLSHEPSPRGHEGGWRRGLDYLRFDGTTDVSERDAMVSHFNERNSRIRLFLISTLAGGLGLNLATASRVIIFDANWNPSHDVQVSARPRRYLGAISARPRHDLLHRRLRARGATARRGRRTCTV